MKITYNLEALKKMTTEDLDKVFNENTTPTIKMVLQKLNRKRPKEKKKK